MSIWRNVKARIARAFEPEEPERWVTVHRDDIGRPEPETRARYQEWADREARDDKAPVRAEKGR